MSMTDDDLLNIVLRQISQAQASGLTNQDRKQALDYYLCRPRGDELAGRSSVISADVADMVHATMAQMLPSFTGDQVCEFEPDAEGDEELARLESDAVNKVMMESSRGFVVFYTAIKDALTLRNGVVKVWFEDDYHGQRVVRMGAIDPINFFVCDDHASPIVDDAMAVHERKVMARGDLLAMGMDREAIEQIPMYHTGASLNDAIRHPQGVRQVPSSAGWSAELVEVWESHCRLDSGTGELELIRTLTGQGVLLLREPAECIPYATGTAVIQSHRWQGLSLYDLEKGVQDVKTATLRTYIDNLRQARTAANSDAVNIDDLITERPKGIVRVKGPVMGNIMDLAVTDLGPSAQALLTYMDKVRSERGGAALEMQSGDPGLMSSQIGASNVSDVLTSTELLGAMYARTLAETLVRSAFALVHKLLRTSGLDPMQLRLADRWVKVDPSQWRERVRVNIKAGLSPGERRRKASSLQAVLQYQMTLLQAGLDGVIVSMPNIYSTVRDWCAAQGLDAGERYFTDPSGQASAQQVQGKMQQAGQKAQQEQQLLQVQVQLEQQDRQLKGQEQQLKAQQAQADAAQASAELKFNYWKESLHAEIEEAKLVAGVTADLASAQQEGRDRADAGAEAEAA